MALANRIAAALQVTGRMTRNRIGIILGFAVAVAFPAYAQIITSYTQTQTLPVPPASSFAGSGGGDGWAVALTPNEVYNVFHHSSVTTVACHKQSDASQCYTPITVKDGSNRDFSSPAQPALYIDQATKKLYTWGTRSDGTAGVVCFDTVAALASQNPFCGFTALSAVGDATYSSSGMISDGVLIGTKWYAFNYVNGSGSTGTKNKLLCFDTAALAACAGQPFTLSFNASNVSVGTFPVPSVAAIGTQVIVPIVTTGGGEQLACFDASTSATCAGAWPVSIPSGYASVNGAAFPLLTASGQVTGFCLPRSGDPCFSLAGASVATPANLTTVVTTTQPWNGPAVQIGPRIYLANGSVDQIQCYDYSTNASCPNFPRSTPGASYIYTTNPDPQRPTCIWINADGGAGQIQNFDAFTAGACGAGGIRVLAASFVVPTPLCTPTTYTKLQVIAPAPGTYTSGTVTFVGGNGAPLPGLSPLPLDNTGSVSLTGLNLNSATGLPQFLINLTGGPAAAAVTIKLDWQGVSDPSCGAALVTPAVANPQNIPTLSEWAMLLMSGLVALVALLALRRSRR